MKACRLERATAADYGAVWALWRACAADGRSLWNEDYPTEDFLRFDMDHGYLYVLYGESGLVGSASLLPPVDLEEQGYPFAETEQIAVLTRLCVQPQLQGRGNGAALLALVEYLAAQRGARALHFLCDVRNAPALALYARAGYRNVCTATLYGETFSVQEKQLPAFSQI